MMAAVNDFERQSMGNICVNPLGNYNSAYTYMYLDGVSYKGGFYISLKNNLVGIAPTLNTSDENWFCSSISGEASEDYVRMYQEVVQNAQKVENDKNTVANDRQHAEQIKNAVLLIQSDVTGKASQVSSDKETVLQAKESVDTSEANVKQIQGEVNQSVTGFSDLVNQSTQESVSKIEESKDAALSAIRSEEESSISNMKTEADQYYSQKKETADIEIEESKNAAISSINQSGTENVNKVISESTNQISLISQEGQTQKQDVTNAGTQEKQSITDLSASKIAEISQEGTKQVGLVTKEGDTQVQRIKDEASGVIDAAQDIQDLKENKLDKNQGTENSGKAMIVGEDGLLTPGDAQTKVDETLTQSGQAADAKVTGDKISELYNTKAPIIYQASSGTEIVVKDSTKAKYKNFGLTGNTEQLETTGAQLLENTLEYNNQYWTYENGIYSTKAGASTYVYKDMYFEAGKYCFSVECLKINGEGKIHIRKTVSEDLKTVTFTNSGIKTLVFEIVESGDYRILFGDNSNSEISYSKPMLNIGETPLPYEPYTGNAPSPSPEYPQDINNSGKEVNGQYEVGVRVGGAQLFDASKLPSKDQDGISVINNGDGSFSVIGNGVLNNTFDVHYVLSREECRKIFSYGNLKTAYSDVYPTARIVLSSSGGNVMISSNDTKTAEIDRSIIESDDLMAIIRIYGLKGNTVNSGTFFPMFYQHGDGAWEPYQTPQSITLHSPRPLTKWDRLVKKDGVWNWEFNTVIIDSYNNEEITTEYMSETGELTVGAKVQYKTATPEYIPLSEEDAQALDSLTSYYPTTVVSTDTDPQMTIDVEYGCDTKTYIDNKISEAITQAITISQA